MSPPPYQLAVDGFAPETFRVRSFVGKELLSEAYSFVVVVTCPTGGEPVERAALGQRAVLVLNIRARATSSASKAGASPYAVALSPDESKVAEEDATGVSIVDVATGALRHVSTPTSFAASGTHTSLSIDEKWLASGSQDHLVRLWMLGRSPSMHFIGEHASSVTALAFSALVCSSSTTRCRSVWSSLARSRIVRQSRLRTRSRPRPATFARCRS